VLGELLVAQKGESMSLKQLLAPVGAALAALMPNLTEAEKITIEPTTGLLESSDTKENNTKSISPILRKLVYQMDASAHALTLHRSSSGTIFAQHGSHASHSSHSSHRSGY
jgi:hypothetical protein